MTINNRSKAAIEAAKSSPNCPHCREPVGRPEMRAIRLDEGAVQGPAEEHGLSADAVRAVEFVDGAQAVDDDDGSSTSEGSVRAQNGAQNILRRRSEPCFCRIFATHASTDESLLRVVQTFPSGPPIVADSPAQKTEAAQAAELDTNNYRSRSAAFERLVRAWHGLAGHCPSSTRTADSRCHRNAARPRQCPHLWQAMRARNARSADVRGTRALRRVNEMLRERGKAVHAYFADADPVGSCPA